MLAMYSLDRSVVDKPENLFVPLAHRAVNVSDVNVSSYRSGPSICMRLLLILDYLLLPSKETTVHIPTRISLFHRKTPLGGSRLQHHLREYRLPDLVGLALVTRGRRWLDKS